MSPRLYYVRHRPQPAGGVCAKGINQGLSELHGQDLLLAASVVDAEDLVEILLIPCHVDAHGTALPVDGQRIGFVQAAHKTPRIVFLAVQLDEAGHALDRFSPQGLRVPMPGGHDQGQGFLVKVGSHPLEFFKSGADAADPVLPAALCVIQTQAHRFSGLEKGHALGVAAVDHSTHLIAGCQRGGFTALLGKEHGLFALGHARVHDAVDHQVPAAIDHLEDCDGVLAVKHIIVSVAVADLRRIDQTGVKLRCNLADPIDVQFPLITAAGDFQHLAVDHHFHL